MGSSPIVGKCHLCGVEGKLSFEHSPPEKAFNDDSVLYAEIKTFLAGGDIDVLNGKIQQRGVGAFTLCESCNSLTGAWYGSAFVSMAKQGMEHLQTVRTAGYIHLPFQIKPLRVIKQVICMFMSSNGPNFKKAQPELARFVLNRDAKHLPRHVHVFAFYTISDRSRSSGVSGLLTEFGTGSFKKHVFSEITFPPFGFVLSFSLPPPDDRLTDITYFADDFGYKDTRTLWLRLPVLPVYTFFPCDYRHREKVLKDAGRTP
jgi:hypothetical protein